MTQSPAGAGLQTPTTGARHFLRNVMIEWLCSYCGGKIMSDGHAARTMIAALGFSQLNQYLKNLPEGVPRDWAVCPECMVRAMNKALEGQYLPVAFANPPTPNADVSGQLAAVQAALTQAQADLLAEQQAHAVTSSLLAERSSLEDTESAGKLAAIRTAWQPFGEAATWLKTGPPSPWGEKLFDYLGADGTNKVATRQMLIAVDDAIGSP